MIPVTPAEIDDPRPDMDADRYELADAIDPWTDEHGRICRPGEQPTWGWL